MTDKTNSADGVEATVDVPDVLESAVLNYGASTQLNRIRKYGDGLNAASFTVPANTTSVDVNYSVSFVITPKQGVNFKPTNVSALIGGSKSNALRYSVTISNDEDESQTLQSLVAAANNNEDGVMTNFDKSVTALASSNSPVTLTIFLATTDKDKNRELMITDVVITGEYTVEGGPVYTKLPKPEITADNAAVVTITASSEATAIKYTTDGSNPSADNGEVYSEPFKVADETIVKAIAIGDVDNLILDSDTAELCVYDNTIAVATPTFKQQNGTVGIYCDTESATIQYSVDNATWTTYARPFTLSENATIYARATKENRTDSEIAEFDVNSVIPSVEGATPHYIGFGSFPKDGSNLVTKVNANGFPEVFATDTDLQGFSLVLERTDGKIQTASNSVKFSNGETRTAFKTSGWKPYRINLPYNLRAVRVELASFINSGSAEPAAYWSEVNGVKYGPEIPMGAINNDLNPADIRVYDLRDSKGNGVNSFTFNYGGQQLGVAVMVEAVPFNLYFVGEQTDWSTNNPDYMFATTDGVTYTLTLPEGITGEWKICNGTWDWSFGKGASITINETCDTWFDAANFDLKTTGETTITFTLVDGSDVQDSSIASKVLVEGEAVVETEEHTVYFAGVQTSWGGGKLELTKNDNGVYTLTLEDGITGEWQIVRDGSWVGSNGSALLAYQRYLLSSGYENNLTLTTNGEATIEVEIEGDATYVTVKTSGYDAVFFDNTEAQWATPHAYVWNKAADTPYVDWPGIAMSQVPAPAIVTYAATNKDVYEVAVPNKGYDMIIFNNNAGTQTKDLELKLRNVYSYSPSTGETTSEPYDGTTGVDEIAVDDANVAPVYYNLQGARVENPANGAYIMVRGSKVTKVIR